MRFIESIKLQDGKYLNLVLHQSRISDVFNKYNARTKPPILEEILPQIDMKGVFKVRMIYDVSDGDATYDIEYAEYIPRKIESLQVVQSELFDYSFKYENRDSINTLVSRAMADDIIIIMNGSITDGSYFNLAFWDGTHWLTPDTPLLKGIKRSQLINERKISEKSIKEEDILSFEKVSLINAMLDLGDIEVPTDQIIT